METNYPEFGARFFMDDFATQWLLAWSSVWLALFLTILLGVLFYRRYLAISAGKAFLLVLLALILTVLFPPNLQLLFVDRGMYWEEFSGVPPQFPFILVRLGLVFFLMPFCAKLYLKWVHDHQVTEAERQPGMEGVRAWLGQGNLIVALLISLFATLNGLAPLSTLLVCVLALLAFPILTTLLQAPPALPDFPKEDLSPEREKIMKLLEDGKITPDEASELLNALGQTIRSRESHEGPVSPSRRTVFIGAALLLIGFLLPWTTLSTSRIFLDASVWHPVTGGQFPPGLGWVVLLLGLAAAVFPYLTRQWDRYTQRNWILALLGLGAIVLLFLLLQIGPFFGIGLILMAAGYALEFTGTLREYHFRRQT